MQVVGGGVVVVGGALLNSIVIQNPTSERERESTKKGSMRSLRSIAAHRSPFHLSNFVQAAADSKELNKDSFVSIEWLQLRAEKVMEWQLLIEFLVLARSLAGLALSLKQQQLSRRAN